MTLSTSSDPTYARPEYPTDPTHDCVGCGCEITGADPLCADDCRPRYDRLGAVEYPELSTRDARWLDRTDSPHGSEGGVSAPVTEELRAAALAAAASNAGSWIEMHADPESCADGPWSDPDDSAVDDDVHLEEIESALGRALTPEEHAAVWPVYRDELARLTAHLPSREAQS